MKGARRTRKPRQQAGFADLMTSSPSSNSLRGVVTGVSRAQTSNPTTPTPTRSNPTTPPPPDDDWGALLHTTPKRRFSPQKPTRGTSTPHSSSSRSSSTLSPRRTPSMYSPRRAPSTPSPKQTPPPQLPNSFASPQVSHTPPANTVSQTEKSAAVPAFLSGWDGADGWGDDPALDESDPETQNDPWGVWAESDDILSQTEPDLTSKQSDTPSSSGASPLSETNTAPQATPVVTKPEEQPHPSVAAEQTVTRTVAEPHPDQHDAVAQNSAPHIEQSHEPLDDEPHQANTDETNVTLTNEQLQPVTAQHESMFTPSETIAFDPPPSSERETQPEAASTAEPELQEYEAQPTAGFDTFSGWAVEEPPQRPPADFPEPDAQHTHTMFGTPAEDRSISVAGQKEEAAETVSTTERQLRKDEAQSTAGFDTFSGWAVEEPPQQPPVDFPEPDTQHTHTTFSAAAEDHSIPIAVTKEEAAEIISPAERQLRKDEAQPTAGFDNFADWAVEEPPQQPSAHFPEPGTHQTDATYGTAVEDTNIPISDPGEEQPKTVSKVDPLAVKDEANGPTGFDAFSGWAVEEPPQQPLVEFPEPDTQQTDAAHGTIAEGKNIPVSINQEGQPVIVPPTEPQIPAGQADATPGFDGFDGWNLEEAPQRPLAEFPEPDTQRADAERNTSGHDADLPIISEDDQRLPEGVPQANANTPITVEANRYTPQQTIPVQSAPDHHENLADNVPSALEASAPRDLPQTSLAVDPWAFNVTGADVPAGDAGWGWGEPDVVPPAQAEPVEKPKVSENTLAAVPSNTTGQAIITRSTALASVLEEGNDKTLGRPIEAVLAEQKEAEPQHHSPHNAVVAEQSAGGENGWEPNDGAKDVNLDAWGWGTQADGEAVEFSIGVNSSKVQTTGPPPSTFSHTSATEGPANDWSNFEGDYSFDEREKTTIQKGTVNTTAGEPDCYTANAYDATNADYSTYAPSKGNVERNNVAETQQSGGASHHEDQAIGDGLGFEQQDGETESLHIGVTDNHYRNEGLGEEGAATGYERDTWTTIAGFSELNLSSTNAIPNLATTSVPPHTDGHEKVGHVVVSETQTQLAVEVPQEENKDSSEGLDTASFLWSGYEDTPQPELDRSWANPDAIWSEPPVPIPSAVTAETERERDAYATHKAAMETKDVPTVELPGTQAPHSRDATAPVSVRAPDVNTSSFESNVPYPPIEQEMFHHYGEGPRQASGTADVMISATENHSPKALGEKDKQNDSSTGAVDWQHSLRSDLQPRMPATSGVTESAQPQNPALSSSYWTERLDESKSLVPGNGNETDFQPSREHEETKGYASTTWSPPHDTSQTDPTTKSTPSHSDTHAVSHEYHASGSEMTESVTGLWSASGDPHHQNGPQNTHWPAPKLSHEGSEGTNRPEISQKALRIDQCVSVDSKKDHTEVLPSEHSTADPVTVGDSFPSEWNQYAPRDNSPRDQTSPSIPSLPTELPLPFQQSAPERQDIAFGNETGTVDASRYDPFAVYQDKTTIDKTKTSYEAFDWGHEPSEASLDPRRIPLALPIAEVEEVNVNRSGSQQDKPSEAQSSARNAGLQSNITPTPPTSNVEASVQHPPLDVFQQAFQPQDAFQIDTVASNDWNASDHGSPPHSLEKKSSDAVNETREDVTGLQPESFGISSHSHSSKVVESETQIDNEGRAGEFSSSGTYDRVANSRQKPQSSSNGIDAGTLYAPRTQALGYSTEGQSVAAQQSVVEAFDLQDNKLQFPQAMTPMELTPPQQTTLQSHTFAYQAAIPDAPSSYSLGESYAPSVPTLTPNGSGYAQPNSEATELRSPSAAPKTVPAMEQTRSEMKTIASYPSGHSTIPALQNETLEVQVTNTNNEIQGRDQNGRYHGVSGHQLNALPRVSSENLDQQVVSHETVPEAPMLNSGPWSPYGPQEVPVVSSMTTATQWNNVGTAYNSVGNPVQGQAGGGNDTVPGGATKAYGSYAMPNELNYSQDLPPPPQQVPYVSPSYSGEQDMFQAESIVDPSAFSYPYSIMDTEITGDFSTRPPRPLFSWGFGGQLVTVIPRVNTRPEGGMTQDRASSYGTSSSTVHIHDLKDITQDGSNDDWAAASEAVPPVSFPTRTPDLSSYAEMCDRLSKLSVGLKGAEAEGRAALWRVLALRCREGASDWQFHASSAVSGPSSVPMFGRNDSSSLLPGNSKVGTILKEDQLNANTSGSKKNEAATEVERLLTLGRGMDAVKVAQEAELWSIALVLAGTMDRSLYLEVVSGYAKSALHDRSALQTLCLSVAEDESEILRKATSPSGLREWRKTVGMLLTAVKATPKGSEAQQSRSLRLIDQIGEALISQNSDFVAGHVCFLISGRLGPLDPPNIQLLGADPKLPAGRPRGLGSPAAVLQSLVLEAVENAANGATYPHLLPHRLVLAEGICAVGRPEVALAHCESISCAVRNIFDSGRQDIASQYFTLPFLSRLESLEQRLLVHLNKEDSGTKRGGLTALAQSLSSVFTKRLPTDSRSGQPQRDENRSEPTQSTQITATRNITSLPPLHPITHSEHLPNVAIEPSWTPKLETPALQPQPTTQPSQHAWSEPQPNDASGNERWNSLVSKTIGFLAPAEGDLSPPMKARNDQGMPPNAQPTPLGLGHGATGRISTLDSHVGHMRSASVGDVPMLQRQKPTTQMYEQSNYSHQVPHGAHSQTGSNHTFEANHVDQSTFNGVPVQKTTVAESNMSPTHRRAASDMTFESQTSEKKPPRPPKKPPTLPSGVDLQPKREKAQAAKGWRSRLSEKIRAAFSGPPRAHMGVENKFTYDKERGRWVIEGEDPDENNDEPPPPPEDEPTPGGQTAVPYSQSYESLLNPDLGSHFSSDSQTALYQSDNELIRGPQMERARRYSHSGQIPMGNVPIDNGYSRDTGSESSVASAASAPSPYSSEPTVPVVANAGNKFRARPGRTSGRRAYVDTFNKGTPPVAMSAAFPNPARPRPPVMNGLTSQAGGAYRIFTPSPAPTSHGSDDQSSSFPGNEGGPVASSTGDSNENVY